MRHKSAFVHGSKSRRVECKKTGFSEKKIDNEENSFLNVLSNVEARSQEENANKEQRQDYLHKASVCLQSVSQKDSMEKSSLASASDLAKKAVSSKIASGYSAQDPGPQQWKSLLIGECIPDEMFYHSTSGRGNVVLATWRADESSRSAGKEKDENQIADWFGTLLSGPLWVPVGVDKVTSQLRPPLPNIPSRLCAGQDVKGSLNGTQLVSNFVTEQSDLRATSFAYLSQPLQGKQKSTKN